MKKIVDSIPIITVVVVLLGYFNVYLKYYFFDIPIYNYLDPSEILFSFSTILSEIAFAVLTIFFSLFITSLFPAGENTQSEFATNLPVKDIIIIILIGGSLTVAISIASAIVWGKRYIENPMPRYINMMFMTIVVIPIIMMFALFRRHLTLFERYKRLADICFIIFLFCIFLSTTNYVKYRAIAEAKSQEKIILTLDDSTEFASNDTLRFVGGTKGFYFFRDICSDNNIIIIPGEKAKKIQIRRLIKVDPI